ncbi:glycosyltransferase family 4 protein [Corynebacterium durum]|uniref:glycosyltransferase family 4 protein n=1 Tax=Corynebacterium durum TaxID=61592 RepID=UPI0028E29168|nr:glycosyltransferase family 4 protein [Corynebacterium durum]
MHIAYVCLDPGIPVFGTKGASVHIQEVVREYRRRGHDVTVYATRRGSDVPDDLAELRIVDVPITTRDEEERERAQQAASASVSDMVRAGGYDLVYERYSLFSTVIAECGVPGILEVNAPLIDEQRTHRVLVDEQAADAALQEQVQAALATICVSDPVRDWVIARTEGTRVFTVPNGVNVHRITPQPESPGAPVVTFVGTLKPWHGVDVLLRARAQAHKDWKLRIIGDGPMRAELDDLARSLGIDVDFRGAVAPDAIPQHMAGTAIGVAPYPAMNTDSDQYFSPLKVYEYMAAGLPVVASRVGQLPEIMGESAYLVPPSDPEALAEALDALVANPVERARVGSDNRRQAEREHSWTGTVDHILAHAGVKEDVPHG